MLSFLHDCCRPQSVLDLSPQTLYPVNHLPTPQANIGLNRHSAKTLCHWKVVRNTWSLTPTIVISSPLTSRNPCLSVSSCEPVLINTVLTEKSCLSMEQLWVADLHGLCRFLVGSSFVVLTTQLFQVSDWNV